MIKANGLKNIMGKSIQQAVAFITTAFLLIVSATIPIDLAAQQQIERPPMEGYAHHINLYSSVSSAASLRCPLGVHHMEVADSNEPPSYRVYCTNGAGGYSNPGTVVSYNRVCARGFTPSSSGPDLICIGTDPELPKPNQCPKVGNPIQPLTGVKYETETDYLHGSSSPLKFMRYYSSHPNSRLGRGLLGRTWRTSLDTRIAFGSYASAELYKPALRYFDNVAVPGGSGNYTSLSDEFGSYWAGAGSPPDTDYSEEPSANLPSVGEHIDYASVSNPDGSSTFFSFSIASPLVGVSESDVKERLKKTVASDNSVTGWIYTNASDQVYTYDYRGLLQRITHRDGRYADLDYNVSTLNGGDDNPDTVDTIIDNDDHTIVLSYVLLGEVPQLVSMQDPDGRLYQYTYNSDEMLHTVTFPINSAGVTPVRTYYYEKAATIPNLFWALTGIEDERGERYVTWDYDSGGRAISSEHGAPGSLIDKVSINYGVGVSPTYGSSTVTNPLGQQTIYHYRLVEGVKKVYEVERLQHTNTNDTTIGCAPAGQYTTFDANGHKDMVADWEGNVTDYDHDSRGLETQRIEGLRADSITSTNASSSIATLPPDPEIVRTFSTLWHPDLRLPTRFTEPDQVIDMTYDCENGRMKTRTIHPNPAPAYVSPSCP